MAFDRDAYVKAYLLPQAKKKLPTLPNDLFERYAIPTPIPSDGALAEHIKSVRSAWLAVSTAATQPPFAKNFAKQCLAKDEEVKKERVQGKDYQTTAWWRAKKGEQDAAAKGRVDELAAVLKESNSAFGVVTRSYLAMCAEKLNLDDAQAQEAAKTVGLKVVGDVAIPDSAPDRYKELEKELGIGGVRTIAELVYPEIQDFAIVDRFEWSQNPTARLDVAAVQNQSMEAERQGNTQTWNARRRALSLLLSEAKAGVDLHKLALYQVVQSAIGSGVPGTAGIKAGLRKLGVVERDANVLAVVLAEKSGGPSGPAKIARLLQEGRLIEAKALARTIPPEASKGYQEILASVEAAQKKLDALLAEATRLLAGGDEIGAAAKVREAGTISAEDAEKMIVTVPISPPLGLTAGVDGTKVRLYWQPNVGHDSETVYEVRRSTGSAAENLASGTPVTSIDGTSATDGAPPTAQATYYSVFAKVAGRPNSRPAKQSIVSVPPVLDPGTEVGPDWVNAHWSTHSAVRHVEAARRDGGRSESVKTNGNSARITGLTEGSSVQIELTAVYEAPDGTLMRSNPVIVTDTPRAAARPLEAVRATPVAATGGVQIRVSWTPVDRSEVRFRRNGSPPAWTVGEMISAEQRDAWGHDVSGSVETAGNQTRLDATLPSGIHYIVPFSKGGTGIVVGKTVAVGVTDPVTGLTHTSFNGFARLAWTWPATSSVAAVSWSRDDGGDDAVGLEKFTRADYDRLGVTVPLGPSPCRVEVSTLMMVDGKTFASPPQTLVIEQINHSPISYTIDSSPGIGPFGGRNKTLNVKSDNATGPVRIVLIAAPGSVMPLEASDGHPILDQTITLQPGRPQSFKVQVPKAIPKPFWVRAFLQSGGGQLVDPPMNTLKEG
jgi:hypothetical protein